MDLIRALLLAGALWGAGTWGQAGETTGTQASSRAEVKIYLIALEDTGKRGQKVGCGDSLVPVKAQVDTTSGPLTAALSRLLRVQSANSEGQDLYNALAGSELSVESVAVKDGTATVKLTGPFQIGGTCDAPRVEAQLRQTIIQFPGVKEAVVSVNGTPLEKLLLGR